jgi:predicted transcriptional regulator
MMAAGRNSPHFKLSESDIQTIKERISAGARQQDLANQYGVSNSLISMIKTGKRRAA